MQVFTRTVKKELLEEVVGSDKWCVNNEYDESQKPLPVKEIISRATAYVGQEVAWQFIGRNCEHFMKKLRYGDTVSEQAFVGGELHNLDMRDDEEYPKSGDLIEINWQLHQHWALYMGGGYIIHVTAVDEGVPSQSGGSRMGAVKTVKRELLKEVAGNDIWAVNNKYDLSWSPRPVEEIIQHAEGCIGKEMAYDMFDFKADDFVRNLRYGGRWRAFHGDGIHHFDKIDIKYYPIPGDLIEIDRGLYQHWALYVGDGYVIHVTLKGENSPHASATTGAFLTRMAKVKKELLEKAVGNDTWRVSNKYDYYWTPRPVEEIIRRAERQVGRIVPYRLFYENCEHFVTELRYGKAYSAQAMTALPIIRSRIADI